MTIAACYLSPEGVVLGADSTTSFMSPLGGVVHHFDFGQKIFQVGTDSTLGITMWGLGELGSISYRTLIAAFADDTRAHPPRSVDEVASRWSHHFWATYASVFSGPIQKAQNLNNNPNRSQTEQQELDGLLQALSGGFCIGGICLPDRTPKAFEVLYKPVFSAPPQPTALQFYRLAFWDMENMINRIIYGIDKEIFNAILSSGRWNGSPQDLGDIVDRHCCLPNGSLPLREAIDWVHSAIYATIKGMKFSHLPPFCGGPIEIAVITSDRPFRWVQHKRFSAAFERGLSEEK